MIEGFRAVTVSMLESVGVLVLDASEKVIAANRAAMQLLAVREPLPPLQSLGAVLAEKLRQVCPQFAGSEEPAGMCRFLANAKCLQCLRIPLQQVGHERTDWPASAILLRHPSGQTVDVDSLALEFRLSAREKEAFQYAIQGLSTKEIAQRMKISTSTVKAFLRMISVKMGVSGRAAVFAKLLGSIT